MSALTPPKWLRANTPAKIPADKLWDLLDKWRAADAHTWVSEVSSIAYKQGLNGCAEDLSDLLLDSEGM